ncbi:hypothetical protein ACHAWF_003796 [Thalassiosira exigua]
MSDPPPLVAAEASGVGALGAAGAEASTGAEAADADADAETTRPGRCATHRATRPADAAEPRLAPQSALGEDDGEDHVDGSHDGDGDDVSPGLAALVAASIRDRVVLEQMDELRMLRRRLAAATRVEITGPNGVPVYARGDFEGGEFDPSALRRGGAVQRVGRGSARREDGGDDEEDAEEAEEGNGHEDREKFFWNVPISPTSGPIPLKKLADCELRIGGVLHISAASDADPSSAAFGIRPGNWFDRMHTNGDMSRSAVVEFNSEPPAVDPRTGAQAHLAAGLTGGGTVATRSAILTFHLTDFAYGPWRSLQSVAMLNRSLALRQRERAIERAVRREERRQIREVERRERAVHEVEEDDDASDYDSDYDEEEDEDEIASRPFNVYSYLTGNIARSHPEQRADVSSVSFCARSVRGRIEAVSRDGDFEEVKRRVFRRIDNLHREELDRAQALEDLEPLDYE